MTIPRKPLKPVKGWVVANSDGLHCGLLSSLYDTAQAARDSFCRVYGVSWDYARCIGYRAVPVVVMERGKK